jgi:hypothetical protein
MWNLMIVTACLHIVVMTQTVMHGVHHTILILVEMLMVLHSE